MVYIPRINFKTGNFPSLLRTFPTNGKYTGTQKLMLTSSRIFGTKIGSGNYPFRTHRMSKQLLNQYRIDPHEFHKYWPTFIEEEQADFKRANLIAWKDEREKRLARRKKK